MCALRRPEQGNPAAALAIIATIFAIAFTIKMLPPATGDAPLPVALRTLPARALPIWSANHEPVSPVAVPLPPSAVRERRVTVISVEPAPLEATADVPLTVDGHPGDAPPLPAVTLMPVELPMAVTAVPVELDISGSPVASSLSKTRSALRMAFVKTGNAIRTAASGTAGVFASNP